MLFDAWLREMEQEEGNGELECVKYHVKNKRAERPSLAEPTNKLVLIPALKT